MRRAFRAAEQQADAVSNRQVEGGLTNTLPGYVAGIREPPAGSCAKHLASSWYERLVLAYLLTQLYFYPYGVTVGAVGSIRVPDVLGMLCIAFGVVILLLRQRIFLDPAFLISVGPFLLLELATPVIGAIGYRQLGDIASSFRMALLWLPMVLLTMQLPAFRAEDFERRLAGMLKVALWANAIYAVIQIASTLGYLPGWLLFTERLRPFAVDRHFDLIEGMRPGGFFINTTQLATFGVLGFIFFYARYISNRQRADLFYVAMAVVVILLTTSRAAYVLTVLIILVGCLALDGRRRLVVLAALGICSAGLLFLIQATVGLEQFLRRFIRIAEAGILEDVSFASRYQVSWPAALELSRMYPVGTLVSAVRVTGVIDSGYLTYFVQGKWAFVGAVAILLGGLGWLGMQGCRARVGQPGRLYMLFLAVYLALAMVTANPARGPLTVFFLTFAFWKVKAERESRVLRITVEGKARGRRQAVASEALLPAVH